MKKYYKTLGGVLSATFEEKGEKDDKGQPIRATEEPMTEEQYRVFKGEQLKKKLRKMFE